MGPSPRRIKGPFPRIPARPAALRFLAEVDEAIASCLSRAAEDVRSGKRDLIFSGFSEGLYFVAACNHLLYFSLARNGEVGLTGIVPDPNGGEIL